MANKIFDKKLISIIIGVIFLGSSVIAILTFPSSPLSQQQASNIFSNASATAFVDFTGNFIIYAPPESAQNVTAYLQGLQKNGTKLYFNYVSGQVFGFIDPKEINKLSSFNTSVEARLLFYDKIHFVRYGGYFDVNPAYFNRSIILLGLNKISFIAGRPTANVVILAQFSKNSSVLSYSIIPAS